jgi:Long-chain acyl-CoA synthetases (AMP-forming)
MAVSYLKGEPLELRWRSSWCEHQARTIPSLFQSQAETLGDSTLYLVKREGAYQPVSWQTVRRDVETLAAALIARGVQPGDRVAILSENRYEWVVADLAILHAGAASVTLHFPLTPEQGRRAVARFRILRDFRVYRAAGAEGGIDPRPPARAEALLQF